MEKKKYIVILIDGAADYKIAELGDKTPLRAAKKPAIDYLAMHGKVGMVKTIPDGMSPGSDTANLSIFGYDPRVYYSGRSSLEAVSMGINLSDNDITFRCNLVTLSEAKNYNDRMMVDYGAGEITTEESRVLIEDLAKLLDTEEIKFYPGVSYRHLIVWKGGPDGFELTPPHDISGRRIGEYLPGGKYKDIILSLMLKSAEILKDHPVNKKRISGGNRPANSIWIWGKGNKPRLDSFYKKYGIEGSVISAVDLVKGIAICAGLKAVNVEGATGNIHTNFSGKANAAINEIKNGKDFVYIHIEAPDECGHQGNVTNKVKAIEIIDEKVVKVIKDSLDEMGVDYKILILPDHPTPVSKMTHTSEPVPFLIYESSPEAKGLPEEKSANWKKSANKPANNSLYGKIYDEFSAQETGLFIDTGHNLLDYFFKK
jgi:2,3-bisphosphoglycerate-independent phosphoglycerate mutase